MQFPEVVQANHLPLRYSTGMQKLGELLPGYQDTQEYFNCTSSAISLYRNRTFVQVSCRPMVVRVKVLVLEPLCDESFLVMEI